MRFRRLESRLVVAFLLMAAVPLLLLSLFAGAVVRLGLERIASPVLGDSFDRSAILAGELRDRLEFDAGRLFSALPPRPAAAADDDAEEDRIRERLTEAGFDFAVWELVDGGTALVSRDGATEPEGRPDRRDWALLAEGRRPTSWHEGTLRFFEAADGGDPARALGVHLAADVAASLDASARLYPSARQLVGRFAPVLRAGLAVGLALTFAITAIAAYLLARRTARRVSRPVAELARAADRLAAGDLAHRAHVRADGEVAELVASFNRMGERLQTSQVRLARAERLAAWRDAARRVAHEIKNPLTPMRLAVHRLRKRVPDNPDTVSALDSIVGEIDNLSRLAGDFSAFAQLPAPSFGPTDLARIAAGVTELFQDSDPNVTVRWAGPASLPLVADRDLLRRVVTNLVRNAVQALTGGGRGGGTVIVDAGVEGDRARLTVTDDGPGIPPELRETFLRPGISGRAGGSGLGLAMVQGIAEDHQGLLEWEDREPGTRFVLDIPIDPMEKP